MRPQLLLSNVSELLQRSQMTAIVCISPYQRTGASRSQEHPKCSADSKAALPMFQHYFFWPLSFIRHTPLRARTGGAGRGSSARCWHVELHSLGSAGCWRPPGAAAGISAAGAFSAEQFCFLPAKQHSSWKAPRKRSCPSPVPEQ